jgi:DNA-directed RNA polymerase specialized sigma24 family protein
MGNDLSVEGARAAFEAALREAGPVVRGRLARRFRDPQLVDEVSGDALASAWERWAGDPAYFDGRDLVAWGCRRAWWDALDRLRLRGRQQPLPELEQREDAERGRDRETTLDCLQRLPAAERDVLVGHFFEGRTDLEMGGLLFGEEGTEQARGLRAWRLRRRAQGRLRDLLLAAGVDPADWGEPGEG